MKSNHVYSLVIQADNTKQADHKAKALKILADNLSVKEIAKMAEVLLHDPIKAKLAKQFLNGR